MIFVYFYFIFVQKIDFYIHFYYKIKRYLKKYILILNIFYFYLKIVNITTISYMKNSKIQGKRHFHTKKQLINIIIKYK